MDDLELGRLEHANLIATWRHLAGRPGGHGSERGGLAMILSGAPSRHYNQIMVADDAGAVDPTVLAEAVAFARSRPAPFMVHLRDSVDDAIRPALQALGLVDLGPASRTPGMAAHPLPSPGAPPHGLTLRVVRTERARDAWLRTLADGFGMDRASARDALVGATALRPDLFLVTGYVGGRAVVTGEGVMTGATVGVYAIATIPEERRRGYGEAITRRVMELGAERGATVAVLQASEMGRPLYERLGFRTVNRCAAWGDPGPA